MLNLDVKDRKILYYLSINSRMSDTQLARKVALSKNAVKYRIERLKKEGIITKFISMINIGAISLDTFTMLLRFNEDVYKNPEILPFFKNHEFAEWVVVLSGNWDMFVEFVYKDFVHLHELINGIIKKFSGILNTYQLFFLLDALRVEHLIEDVYKGVISEAEKLVPAERTAKRYMLDEIDRKILQLLSQDSSLGYVALAEKSGLSLDIVRYRIKQLLNKGIIIKFFADVSLRSLGYASYLYIMKLKNLSDESINRLKLEIRSNTNITYAFFDLTSFTLIFVCLFKSSEEIDHLSRMLRQKYLDIIDEQNFFIITEQLLFNLFPEGILRMN